MDPFDRKGTPIEMLVLSEKRSMTEYAAAAPLVFWPLHLSWGLNGSPRSTRVDKIMFGFLFGDDLGW